MSEGVPADVLRDPNLGCSWTDYLSHEALAPIWSLPTRCSAREYPIVGLAVFCVVRIVLRHHCFIGSIDTG